MKELKRWILVVVMGVVVAALAFRTFLAVYLFLPLGLLLAAAVLRAVTRFIRGLANKNPADVTEAYRSIGRVAAWGILCGVVVVGHDALAKELRLRVEKFALAMDERRVDGAYPETAPDVPPRCTYGRPVKERFFVVCTFTPPFEKATFTSDSKRWDN